MNRLCSNHGMPLKLQWRMTILPYTCVYCIVQRTAQSYITRRRIPPVVWCRRPSVSVYNNTRERFHNVTLPPIDDNMLRKNLLLFRDMYMSIRIVRNFVPTLIVSACSLCSSFVSYLVKKLLTKLLRRRLLSDAPSFSHRRSSFSGRSSIRWRRFEEVTLELCAPRRTSRRRSHAGNYHHHHHHCLVHIACCIH